MLVTTISITFLNLTDLLVNNAIKVSSEQLTSWQSCSVSYASVLWSGTITSDSNRAIHSFKLLSLNYFFSIYLQYRHYLANFLSLKDLKYFAIFWFVTKLFLSKLWSGILPKFLIILSFRSSPSVCLYGEIKINVKRLCTVMKLTTLYIPFFPSFPSSFSSEFKSTWMSNKNTPNHKPSNINKSYIISKGRKRL